MLFGTGFVEMMIKFVAFCEFCSFFVELNGVLVVLNLNCSWVL